MFLLLDQKLRPFEITTHFLGPNPTKGAVFKAIRSQEASGARLSQGVPCKGAVPRTKSPLMSSACHQQRLRRLQQEPPETKHIGEPHKLKSETRPQGPRATRADVRLKIRAQHLRMSFQVLCAIHADVRTRPAHNMRGCLAQDCAKRLRPTPRALRPVKPTHVSDCPRPTINNLDLSLYPINTP